MQAKRIQVLEGNLGVNAQVVVQLLVPDDPREEVNFHNIWASASCEPETAGANCQGTWVLQLLRAGQSQVVYSDANTILEARNPDIIACGVFSASNETPWNSGAINPKTSRTLNPKDSLRMVCCVTGITADLASTRVMLCAHTTRK